MESPVLKLKRKKGPNLLVLTHTKTIREEDVEVHAKWEVIKRWYDQTQNHPDVVWLDKAMTSVINSIVHQNRKAFAVTLEKTKKLIKNDKNWEEPLSMGDKKYRFLFKNLIEAGVIEEIRPQKHKEPWLFRVIDEDVSNMLELNVTEKDQESELIDFVDKNQNEIEGANEGANEGTKQRTENKRIRDIENKTDIEPNQKITFQQLLFKQHPDKFPSFDDLTYLAELAVENCQDFEVDTFTLRVFKKHLESTCKKITPKQKKFIDMLVKEFEFQAEKYANLRQIDNIELKQPTELQAKAIVKEYDNEDVNQSNTLNILKTTFGKDKITALKGKIERTKDLELKQTLQMELEYWEKVL